uniref:Uncharacterized protein n=1 Tax=Arundo donax TaxID=35708 RepID=A0A0A9HA76_ARUDO
MIILLLSNLINCKKTHTHISLF